MSGRRRLYAWILCLGMLAALFVSSAYILSQSGHDCAGDACETCVHIARVRALLRGCGELGFLFVLCAVLPGALRSFRMRCRTPAGFAVTPVRLRVRLNN